jgi:hypothetical protein
LLSFTNAKIKLIGVTAVADGAFAIWINGKKVIIDYSDHLRDGSYRFKNDRIPYEKGVPIFKFHYSENVHEKWERYFPFSPVSFYDWDYYNDLKTEINYKAIGNIIINRQKPYGNAAARRARAQLFLKNRFGKNVKCNVISQVNFWFDLNNCLISIFIPGCRNDILDRSPLQYMAFGGCFISPKISTMLSFNKLIIPNEHYIKCKDDYSDLLEKVEWARNNRDTCVKIGNNAKQLFQNHCTPEKLVKWMIKCIKS